MKILSVYNHYQQPGGEDVVVEQETALLRSMGHEVVEYRRSNHEVDALGLWGKATILKRMVWASDAVRDLRHLSERGILDVAHFHNTHFMISPAAYSACRQKNVPVVQTLHNYRLLCPNALFYRDGHVCEDCLGKTIPWPGVLHACYRSSRLQTQAVAAMLTFHRMRQTWQKQVSAFITLTEFNRQKFIQGGFPAEKIVVKPNFIHTDPGPGDGQGDYALFVGRLSPEKGINTLLMAWQRLSEKLPLKIIGDGPLTSQVTESVQRYSTIDFLGRLPKEQVLDYMKSAQVLIFPSECYEGFPMVIVEAYATGLPVLCSGLGSMASLIDPGRTGLHFQPGDPDDLAAQVEWLMTHPHERAQMRQAARAEFEAKYTAERNYQMLMEIYDTARGQARA